MDFIDTEISELMGLIEKWKIMEEYENTDSVNRAKVRAGNLE